MTKTEVKRLREEINSHLLELGVKLNIIFKAGNGRYGDNYVTFKLECNKIGKDGKTYSKTEEDFKLYASSYGLDANMLHTEFEYLGEKFEIVGLKPRASKYPVVGRNKKTGLKYKFKASMIKREVANVS